MDDFRLGPWVVRPELNRISSDDQDVQIEPRLMRVLEILATRAPEVVSRDELLELVWHDVLVGEEALTVAISQLRRLLDDDAREPRYIETIRKRGYRVLERVSRDAPEKTPGHFKGSSPGSRQLLLRVAAAAAGITLIAIAWLVIGPRSGGSPDDPGLESRSSQAIVEPVPLTSDPGWERLPAVAPDGARVAYCRRGDVFVTQRGDARATQLTDDPAPELYPTWSPDGQQLAFVRQAAEEATIEIVSALGGPSRSLVSIDPWIGGLDWSPNGDWLAVSAATDPKLPYLIALVDPTTGAVRQLTSPQPAFACDSWPRFSPDGSQVAFVRASWSIQHELYTVPVAGGVERRIAGGLGAIRGFDWIDSDSIVLAATGSGQSQLVVVELGGGVPERLPLAAVESAEYPSVAADSLVFEHTRLDRDIWESSLGDDRTSHAVIDSTRIDAEAVISPDNRSIAFVSLRTGEQNLWLCDRDGGNPRPLTSFAGSQVKDPAWSPDGRLIGFTAVVNGRPKVYVVSPGDRRPTSLSKSTETTDESFSTWSRDGRRIYFGRVSDDRFELWEMAVDGSRRRPVATDGQNAILDTESGIVCLRSGPSLWRIDHSGTDDALLADQQAMEAWITMATTRDTIFAMTGTDGETRLVKLDPSTGRITDGGPLPVRGRFSVAPDARSILVEQDERHERDLMLARLPAGGS